MGIERKHLFEDDIKIPVKFDGMEASYNVFQLTNGRISLYMLEAKLTDNDVQDAIYPHRYTVQDDIDRKIIERLDGDDLKQYVHERATDLITAYMPEIREHREAKKAFMDIDRHLRKDLKIVCAPRAFF